MSIKRFLSIAIGATMLFSSFTTGFAQSQPTMDISQWAVPQLNEAERYGIYPIDWYYNSFRSAISAERLNTLLSNTEKKIELLGMTKNESFKPATISNPTSREGVLTALYNLIGKYNVTGKMAIGSKDPVSYMTELAVVVGDKTGLSLDKPCSAEQAIIFSSKLINQLYQSQNAGSEGLLWKAVKGSTTVYMLGSIHIADASIYPMDQTLTTIFDESSALLVEANLFNQTEGIAYMQSHSVFSDGKQLKDVISASAYAEVQKAFEKYGIPEATYATLKPWTAANTLLVLQMSNASDVTQAGSATNAGVDMYFLSKALISGKPIVELEGLKFQTDLFDNMSPEIQEKNLLDTAKIVNGTVSGENKEASILTDWLALWKKGDEASFKKAFNTSSEEATDEYTKALFGERDKAMAEKVAKLLEQNDGKTYFVVVGAGHLAMETSVVEILNKQGYSVVEVN